MSRHRHSHHHRGNRSGGNEQPTARDGASRGAERRLVLAGNPNTGKSVLFHAFTGIYVEVSNFPGTTVDVSTGRWRDYLVVDTPGVYGVSDFNDEERVARDVILSADVILNVVDAVHLERDLFLTLQLADMGKPMLVALNMMDEAHSQGVEVDVDRLEAELGVPVIPTVAISGRGLDALQAAVARARPAPPDAGLRHRLEETLSLMARPDQAEGLMVLEGDRAVAARLGLDPASELEREHIYLARRRRVDDMAARVVRSADHAGGLQSLLGRWMLRPWSGLAILVAVLAATYLLVGVFVAQTVVGFTEETVFLGHYEPWVKHMAGRFLDPSGILGRLLVGEFGVLTMSVTYIFGLLLPLVVGFYLALSIMEDSGYLPRLATLVDRLLTGIGLNGRAIIPTILGLGCVTMATVTTRLLGSERERRIAIILLSLAIPCSAQLGVIAAMIAPLGPTMLGIYIATITLVFALVGAALNRVLPGESTALLIDLPPLRLPRPVNVLRKTWSRSEMFIREAGPLFVWGALGISLLEVSGLLMRLQAGLSPLTMGWLGLPRETATAFIMGFVRRDFGAAGLYDLSLTGWQTVVALTTITLFVPCIASVLIILKERGRREGALIWAGNVAIAFVVGGLVAKLGWLARW